MSRKQKLLIILGLVIAVMSMAAVSLYRMRTSSKENKGVIPNLSVTDPEGKTFLLRTLTGTGQKKVLIYYDSKCGKCRDVISELKKAGHKRFKLQVIMLSVEEPEELLSVKNSFPPHTVEVFQVEAREIFKAFGSLKTPQIFIYDPQGRLISEPGQDGVQTILSQL